MLRVGADDHDLAFALDYLALLAHFLYGRSDFHFMRSFRAHGMRGSHPGGIYVVADCLFRSPGNAAFCKVVYRDLYRDLVAGEDPYIVHPQLAAYAGGHYMIVGQLDLEGGVRQSLYNGTLKLNNIVFGQKNPSSVQLTPSI
jgi:hypothetical protein